MGGPRRQVLPLAPVSAVTSVTLIDVNAVETTIAAAAWRLIPDGDRPVLAAVSGALPTIPTLGAVRIAFTAGYGAAFADLPGDLRQAVLMLAAHSSTNIAMTPRWAKAACPSASRR